MPRAIDTRTSETIETAGYCVRSWSGTTGAWVETHHHTKTEARKVARYVRGSVFYFTAATTYKRGDKSRRMIIVAESITLVRQ